METTLQTIERIKPPVEYAKAYKHFEKWLGGRAVTFDTVREYFLHLKEHSNLAAGTQRIYRAAVKAAVKGAVMYADLDTQERTFRLLKSLDTGETRAPKVNKHRAAYLTQAEVKMLILKSRSRRQMAVIRLFYATGCRVAELCNLKVCNCRREGDTVDMRVLGKGSKERHIQVSADLYNFVRETFRGEEYLMETQNGRPYNTDYISHQISKLGKDFLGKKISVHTLRHSFATTALHDLKEDLGAVSRYMGHSSVAITADIYVHTEVKPETLRALEL